MEEQLYVLDNSYAEFWSEYIQFKEVTNNNVIYFCSELEDCTTDADKEPKAPKNFDDVLDEIFEDYVST